MEERINCGLLFGYQSRYGGVEGFLFSFLNFYLFMAVLGLHFYTQAFSSCGEWGLLSSCSARVPPLQWLLLLQNMGSGRCWLQWL